MMSSKLQCLLLGGTTAWVLQKWVVEVGVIERHGFTFCFPFPISVHMNCFHNVVSPEDWARKPRNYKKSESCTIPSYE